MNTILTETQVTDLFEKDVESVTKEERAQIIAYYQAQAKQFAEAEAAGKRAGPAKKGRKPKPSEQSEASEEAGNPLDAQVIL